MKAIVMTARFWLADTSQCCQAGQKNRPRAYPENIERNAYHNNCCEIFPAAQFAFAPWKLEKCAEPIRNAAGVKCREMAAVQFLFLYFDYLFRPTGGQAQWCACKALVTLKTSSRSISLQLTSMPAWQWRTGEKTKKKKIVRLTSFASFARDCCNWHDCDYCLAVANGGLRTAQYWKPTSSSR